MTRSMLPAAAALVLSLATASRATARTLWEDTVVGTTGGAANAVLATSQLVVAGGGVPAGNHSEALLRAYEPTSGSVRWSDQHAISDASEAVADLAELDGRGFAAVTAIRFTFGSPSDWVVRAFDMETGAPIWDDARTAGRFDRADDVAAADGRVFAAGRISVGESDAAAVVRAYDAPSGTLLWEDVGAPGVLFQGESRVVADDGVVLIASPYPPSTRVRSYDAASGALLWSVDVPSGSTAGLAIAAGRVFVSTRPVKAGLLHAYDARSGALVWERELEGGAPPGRTAIFDMALAASDDALYVGVTLLRPESALLDAYDATTGATLWHEGSGAAWALTLAAGRLYAAPALHGFTVHAFDAVDGRFRWLSQRTDPGRTLALAARDGVLYAAGLVGSSFTQSFHVAAFDGSRAVALRPIIPNGRRLPITR